MRSAGDLTRRNSFIYDLLHNSIVRWKSTLERMLLKLTSILSESDTILSTVCVIIAILSRRRRNPTLHISDLALVVFTGDLMFNPKGIVLSCVNIEG